MYENRKKASSATFLSKPTTIILHNSKRPFAQSSNKPQVALALSSHTNEFGTVASRLDSTPKIASDNILTRTGRSGRRKRTRTDGAAGAVVRLVRQDFCSLPLRTG